MRRILVAGIGNVFFGDDGFGVEVVRRLAEVPLPRGVELLDVGIRGLHLAYRLLDGYDLLLAVDLVTRGEAPGTVHVIEPEGMNERRQADACSPDAHAVDLPSVLAMLRAMDGAVGRVLVVGCEPQCLNEGMELSAVVEAAIEPAMRLVREIVEGASSHETVSSQTL